MLPINNKATQERSIVIPTLDTVINNLITDLEEKIFEKEGDAIATYLANILKVLKEMNFQFPEIYRILGKGDIIVWKGLNANTKAELIDNLSDPVKFFIEEKTDIPEINEEEEEGIKHSSNIHEYPVKIVYSEFVKWCKGKGIAPLPKQTFTEKFSEFYPKKRKRVGGKLTYVFTNLILLDDSQVGTPKKIQKDMQDNNSEYMECLFQLMSNLLITPLIESNKGGILIINTKLEQGKKLFESNAGLISRCKPLCSNLFTPPENLDEEGGQGSGQGSSEGIPIEEFSKIEHGSNEGKGEESISDFQALKDYHYFKSEDYYPDTYFKNLGIQNIEHKEYGNMHYYKIPYSEISKDKYAEFSSRFASNSKVFVIDENEYNSIKVEEGVK